MSFSTFCGPTSGVFGPGRFAQTRGRVQGSITQGVNYPSPFFDVAHTYLPTTVKQLFRFCRYYFLTNPLVNATVFKLAEYPVTDIIIDHENPKVKQRWMEYYHDHLRYRAFQVESGLDYFCLAGNTRVITEEGVRDIRDLAGKTVRVLSQGGVYREASFRSYGRQELWEVHTDDGVLLATAEHEWPVLDKNTGREIRRTTRQLAGRSLYRQVATRPEQDKEFWTGVRHGIVFGDGTLSNDDRQAHVIFYSTGKKQVLARYFEGHGTITPHHEGKYLGVYGQPPHFKKMPEDTCSRSYWYGFVCGLFSTDGSVDVRGQAVLTQKDRSVLLAIAHRLPWLGILGGRVREHWAWNSFTKQQEPMNYLSLKTQYMDPQDFVRPDQREAFVEKYEKTNYGKNMRVKKVVQTGRVEEVFCCVEPETHSFTIENGVLTGNCYGNGLNSLSFPFQKYLTCRTCQWTERADKTRRFWTFTNLEFRLQCPRCGQTGAAIAYDHYYRNASGIRLVRWNVEDVEINYNDISGESTYFYTVPGPLRNDILIGKKDVVQSVPQIFIQAIKQRKGVIFSKENLFHLKRPTLAWQDRGWGTPLILPVLKDTFYLQIMKKAQEAVLLEHIVPLRIVFPQAASGSSDPFTSINLIDWRDQVAAEIARWRYDCVSPTALVETRDGVVPAGFVEEGDLIRNHLGGYSRVEKTWRRPLRKGEVSYQLRVRGLGGVAPVVSEGHPFLAARAINKGNGHKLGEAAFIRVKDLRAGDYVGYPTHLEEEPFEYLDLGQYTDRACTEEWCYIDHTAPGTPEAFEFLSSGDFAGDRAETCKARGWTLGQFKAAQNAVREGRELRRLPRRVKVTPDLLWVLGMYLAEGSTSDKQVLFAANKKEGALYERVYTVLRESFGAFGFEADKGGEGCQHVFSSVVAAQVFSALCHGNATTKRIHERLMHLPMSLRPYLVDGMLTGDGCAHEDGVSNKRSYTSASASLACGLQRILLSLGVAAGVSYSPPSDYEIRGRTGRSSGAYRVGIYGDSNRKLSLWLDGHATAIDPVSRMGVFRDGYFWFRVIDVEEEHVDEVIGFQVDQEDARVRLEDDTEAHGTFCLAGLACANSNYIPIMPLPLGQQSVGGDGRALLLFNEMQTLSEHIIMGMGVPREFLMGGLSYAGTNVSMRMLENSFLSYVGRHRIQAKWVMKMVAHFMGWPEANVRFKPFKMADDLQRKAYLFQLNQAGKVSDQTLLADADLEQEEEDEIMIRETDKRLAATKKQQLAMAEVQGEQQVIMMKLQAKAQEAMAAAQQGPQAPGEPGGPEGMLMGGAPPPGAGGAPPPGGQGAPPPEGAMAAVQSPLNASQNLGVPPEQAAQPGTPAGMDIMQMAQSYAEQILQLPPDQQQMALEAIAAQSPELAQMVQQFLTQRGAGQPQPGPGVDQRPLPEKLPARRAAQLV